MHQRHESPAPDHGQPNHARGLAASIALAGARHGIDRVDAAMLALLVVRREMAGVAGGSKRTLRHPLRDVAREARVRERIHDLAGRLRIPRDTADALASLLMADARRRQRRADVLSPSSAASAMTNAPAAPTTRRSLLRLVPPPRRWRPLLRLVPPSLHTHAMESALSRTLSPAHVGSALEAVEGRRLGIEVEDLDLRWVFAWRDGRLHAVGDAAEATVRGSATDLLLLASRLEDADTLFFQRRLVLTGDTELGLTVRNLLDRMPWESLPLGLRILLQRSARLAREARDARPP